MFNLGSQVVTGRKRVGIDCSGNSLTKQGFKHVCDINKIIERYRKTGIIEHVNSKVAMYGDFSNVGDYREALAKVSAAGELFRALPAKVRERFSNDPAEMLEFVNDVNNRKEAEELGFIIKKSEDKTIGDVGKSTPDVVKGSNAAV